MTRPWKSIVAGAFAGTANGLFGSGGGLFLVPLYEKWLTLDAEKAFASSVAVIFALSGVSLILFLRHGTLDFTLLWPFLAGGAIGGLCAGILMKRLSPRVLHRLFGLLLLYGGVKALFLL